MGSETLVSVPDLLKLHGHRMRAMPANLIEQALSRRKAHGNVKIDGNGIQERFRMGARAASEGLVHFASEGGGR